MCYDFGMLHVPLACDADYENPSIRALTTVADAERKYNTRRHEDGAAYLSYRQDGCYTGGTDAAPHRLTGNEQEDSNGNQGSTQGPEEQVDR